MSRYGSRFAGAGRSGCDAVGRAQSWVGPRYAIIEELRGRSGGVFALPEGTVYPALHRLEQEGLLSSRWAAGPGRRRRVYELTPRGRLRLGARRRAWADFAVAVSAVLEEPSCATSP
ncbi:MAG: PadR family transcriptional regulator [Solirubrobacteraceae bacterium]